MTEAIPLEENIYIVDGVDEVIILEEEDGLCHVRNLIGNASWWVAARRVKEKLMKAIPINDVLLESLPNGRYAVFINNKLHEVILVENYDKDKILFTNVMPVVGCIGKDEILTAGEYIGSLPEHKTADIILADQITLNGL